MTNQKNAANVLPPPNRPIPPLPPRHPTPNRIPKRNLLQPRPPRQNHSPRTYTHLAWPRTSRSGDNQWGIGIRVFGVVAVE